MADRARKYIEITVENEEALRELGRTANATEKASNSIVRLRTTAKA